LIAAICPEPELLVLDEPTSGLDPIVRREFIETVIGAYQNSDPGNRTILVSTHLITEFEGLIDEFTIIDGGRAVLSLEADHAREQFQKIRARFSQTAPDVEVGEALQSRSGEDVLARLKEHRPEFVSAESLTLEEIFVATLQS
jgi:ABC-2 type transport system ATP-binding protein